VKTFVAKKARSVITDVAKLDVVSDGLLHNQLLNFCQNTRMAFLGRNTPTPLLSELMAQVDDTIVEAVCRHGTGGGHVDWSPHFRKFASMKIQVPHFRGVFGITPNEGSAILAFYSATCALVVWLGSHGCNRPAQDFADTWAPGLNLTIPDSWHAPLLQALSASHALLLQDYGCVEWTSESDRVPSPLAVSIALPFVQPSVGSRNSPPPLSTVTLPQLRMLFQSTHEDRHGAEAPAEPGETIAKSPLQRTLTVHIMGRWPKHEGALAHISLQWSVEMLALQCAHRFPARPAGPDSFVFAELFPAPQPEPSQPNVPTAKAKQMHLNWNPLGFLSELSKQKSVPRFPPDGWQVFFCRSFGAPIPKMLAHAHSRTLCSCKM